MLDVRPEGRDRRIVSAILVLAAIALFFIVVGQIGTAFFFFGDVLLTFFLAWLLAFIISPLVSRIVDFIPRLPRAAATILVYVGVVLTLVVIVWWQPAPSPPRSPSSPRPSQTSGRTCRR